MSMQFDQDLYRWLTYLRSHLDIPENDNIESSKNESEIIPLKKFSRLRFKYQPYLTYISSWPV